MGWGIPKLERDKLLADCTVGGKTKPSQKYTTFTVVDGTYVFVDAPAVLRSNCVPNRSPLDVARSVCKRICDVAPNAGLIDIFFDSSDQTLYPPQRAQLHEERYRNVKGPSYEQIEELAERYACKPKHFGSKPLHHLPFLKDTEVDWKLLFSCSTTKALAYNLLASAMHHTFLETYAAKKGIFTRIYRPDNTTVNVICPDVCSDPPAENHNIFGEADLKVFHAARHASMDGHPTLMCTIDTDFLLMSCCSDWNPTAPAILDLKTSAICLQKLTLKLGGTNAERRLNSAFWLLACGTDYSQPLTRAGYYTKGLLEVMGKALKSEKKDRPLRAVHPRGWSYDSRVVFKTLATIRKRKPKPGGRKLEVKILKDMLFSLMYYGFHFEGSFPPHPSLSKEMSSGLLRIGGDAVPHAPQVF
jgi:hypothetical protein